MIPDRRVLVTGSTGFVGTRLLPALRAAGLDPVRAGDGRLPGTLDAPPGIARVVHLAALTFVPDSWRDPVRFHEVNVIGTLRVLEYCRQNSAGLVCLSSYVYGEPQRLPIDEDHPVQPATPYALTKQMVEEACRFYARAHGLDILVVRPFNLYGPGQRASFLIPTLLDQLLDPACDAVTVMDDEPKRDFLYIDDLVDLLVAGVVRSATGLVNAGSGESHSVRDIHHILVDLLGREKPLRSEGRRRAGEVMDVVADVRHARELLGWSPVVGIHEGLRRTLDARLAEAALTG